MKRISKATKVIADRHIKARYRHGEIRFDPLPEGISLAFLSASFCRWYFCSNKLKQDNLLEDCRRGKTYKIVIEAAEEGGNISTKDIILACLGRPTKTYRLIIYNEFKLFFDK